MPCFGDVERNVIQLAVEQLLAQDFTAFELIVLTDSGGPPGSELWGCSRAADPRLVQLEVSGPAAALRAVAYGEAMSVCGGGYVLVLPSAAILRDDGLGHVAAAVQRRPEREVYYFGGPGFRGERVRYDLMLRNNSLADAALLVRRECLREVGLPDPHVSLARHFLWDWSLRVLQYHCGTCLSPRRPYIERFAPLLDGFTTTGEEDLECAVARRMMATDRREALSLGNWFKRPVAAVNESVLPGLSTDERDYLERRVAQLGLTSGHDTGAATDPAAGRIERRRSLRVSVLATCDYLDTANVFVEQPLLEIMRDRPLHYRLAKATDATAADLDTTDLLLLSRTLFEGWERALELAAAHRRRNRPVAFVMDDDLFDLPGDVVINEPIPVARRFEMFLPHLDALIVAAPYLQTRMRERFPDLPVHCVDNSCCVSHIPAGRPKQPRVAGQLRVALTLTSSARLRVRAFADGLHCLPADVREAVELHVFGETGPVRDWLPFPRKVCHHYLPYLEYLSLLDRLQLDLAWVPLPGDHDFYHCKTAVKYYEFAGLGVPGIYSRVPIYESAVRHGETGWLVANTSEDWCEAITRLVRVGSLRASLAVAARVDAFANHSVRTAADQWWGLLRQIAPQPLATRLAS